MAKEILVTGAGGFVGRTMVGELSAAGFLVRAVSRRSRPPTAANIDFVPTPKNPTDPRAWKPLIEGVSAVIHLAGIAHASSKIPETEYMRVNCDAAHALTIAAREAEVSCMIYVSSIRAQTGPTAMGVLTEADPPAPTDAYGRSKLAGENAVIAELNSSSTRAVVLRPVLIFGPGVKGNMRTLFKLARVPLPLPVANLAGKRSVLSLKSLTSAVIHILQTPVCQGIYLLADNEPLTVPEILAALRKGLHRPRLIFPAPLGILRSLAQISGRKAIWDRLAGDLIVDTSRLQSTGWRQSMRVEDALARAISEDRNVNV